MELQKLSLVVIAFIMATISSQAQYVTLKGSVVDQKTKEGLPYVNIFPENTDYGTFTNHEGDFELLIHEKDYNGKIVFSFVGFRTKKLWADSSKAYYVELRPSDMFLEDVVITPVDPIKIINNFWQKIAVNYPDQPVVHTVYVRESEKLADKRQVYFSELIADYYRSDYFTSKEDKIRFVKGRNKEFFNFDSLNYSLLEGGSALILSDIVKYPRSFIKPNQLKHFNFELVNTVEFDGDEIYHIAFTPKTKKGRYQGSLFINSDSYALVKAEVSYSENGLKWINSSRHTGSFTWSQVTSILNYKKMSNNTYALNEIVITGIGKDPIFDQDITSVSELFVINTEFNPASDMRQTFERIDDNTILTQLGSFENSETFWADYNHLLLESDETFIFELLESSLAGDNLIDPTSD